MDVLANIKYFSYIWGIKFLPSAQGASVHVYNMPS